MQNRFYLYMNEADLTRTLRTNGERQFSIAFSTIKAS